MDLNAIAVEELINEGPVNQLIAHVGLDFVQPINIIDNNIYERNRVPRNTNYYEDTIPLYVGDLFVEHFRMSRETFEQLINVIGNNGLLRERRIPLEKKLLFTIWVLAKPESFLAAGDRFGFARSTAHETFKEGVNALVALMNRYIVSPNNHNESVRAFYEQSRGFPGVIGAIDGCHIPIKQPTANANDYYNRKQVHSIILQGICDHRRLFLNIYVGMPGRVHDARVFRTSPIWTRLMDNNNPLLAHDLHIVGDSAYPLMENLLTPFRDNGHLTEHQIRYNIKLCSARVTIERAFGRLKGKFRRLKYLDIAQPEFGTAIIVAACVLHNFTILQGDDVGHENVKEIEVVVEDADILPPLPNERVGIIKRNNIVTLLRH